MDKSLKNHANIEYLILGLAARGYGHEVIGLAHTKDDDLREIEGHARVIGDVAHFGEVLLGKLLTIAPPDDLDPADTTIAGDLIKLLAELRSATTDLVDSAEFLKTNPDARAKMQASSQHRASE